MTRSAAGRAAKKRGFSRYFETDHVKRNLKERAIQGGVVTYLSRVVNYVIQMAGTVLLARLLVPEDFGLIAMVTSLNGILLQLRDIGLSDAVIQTQSIDQKQMSNLFWINAFFNSGLSVLIVSLSPLIARFYNEPKLVPICIILSLSFVFYGLSDLHYALLKRSMHFWSVAVAGVVGNFVSNLAAIVLAWQGYGYWALVVKNVAVAVCMVVVGWIACGWRPGLPARKAQTRHLILFGANTMGFLTVNFFTRNLDKTLVGWKYGAGELGYYDKAYNLFLLPISQLAMSQHHVAVATLSKLRGEPAEFKRYYLNAVAIIAFLGMPVCAFLGSVSREIVLLLLGPKWAKTTELLFFLSLSGGIHIVYSTAEWLHASLGRADRWIRWGIFAFIITVVGYIVGVFISVRAVAIAYTLSIFVLVGPALAYAGQPIGLRFGEVLAAIWKFFVAAALAGLCCWLVLNLLMSQGSLVLRLFVAFCIYTLAYLAGTIGLHGSTKPLTRFISLVVPFFRRTRDVSNGGSN